MVQQEAVALLEAHTSEDGASEEGIAAVQPGDSLTPAEDAEPEDAARALLNLPGMFTGESGCALLCPSAAQMPKSCPVLPRCTKVTQRFCLLVCDNQ